MGNTRYLIGGALLAAAVYAVYDSIYTIPKNAKAVQPFDLEKYLGKWYEIARIDFLFERNLSHTSAHYSLNEDGSVKVVNKGFNVKTGKNVESEGRAKFVGNPSEAKLKVSFFGPFYAGYNVIAIDENYNNALVCGKNMDYLWILSRRKSISEKKKIEFLTIAEEIGFDTNRLVWVNHEVSS